MRGTLLILALVQVIFNLNAQENPALDIQIKEGPNPWTKLELNNESDQFQFAVVSDRTGGHRPGVFMKGVRKLNLLQPEFVMSVGDLIEGYTQDLTELNRQWDEFDSFVNQLEMPFFYVPGNHDITNPVMARLWEERLGETYYSFVYKDVLFLCLNSEDQARGAGRGSISEPQFKWIKDVLAEHEDVRWTLVFMHQPLWRQNVENEETNPVKWYEVEEQLRGRAHTVFVGHQHHYVKFERNNANYIMLATTGGGSSLRGPEFGEFDQVAWITMTEDGPIIANLAIDYIFDENLATEVTEQFAGGMWRNPPFTIEPLYTDIETFESGKVRLKITNDEDVPMMVKVKNKFSWDFKSDLSQPEIEVGPNSVEFLEMEIARRGKAVKSDYKGVELEATVAYVGDNMPKLEVPFKYLVGPENKYTIAKDVSKVAIDGNLKEWGDLPYKVTSDNEADISARFDVSYDDQFVYVAAQVTDDNLQLDTGTVAWQQDYVGVVINADPMGQSAMNQGGGWYSNSFVYIMTPETEKLPSSTFYDDRLPENVRWKCIENEGGYAMEIALPLDYVKERQGEDWKTLRINVGVQDQDVNEKEKPRYNFVPAWRNRDNRAGSGMFFKR